MESDRSTGSSFDVLNNGDDYIVSNFDTVYPVLRECLTYSTDYTSIGRALKLTFGPCLDLFTIDELEENLFKYACPGARNTFTRTLESIGSTLRNGENCIITNFLQICQEILLQLTNVIGYITKTVPTIKLLSVKSLLLCSTEILYECYQHFIKSEECYGLQFSSMTESLTAFFKKAQVLQFNILQLLSRIEVNYEQYEIDILNEVLTYIYKSGMIVLNLDIKAMADLWKGYICALTKYSEHLKTCHEIDIPLQCLLTNFINNLQNLISGDCIDSQKFEKMVKILCFILKIVIKITEKFNGCIRECQSSLINLLIILNRISDPHLKMLDLSVVNTESLKQLVIGMDPLINHLITDNDFVQEISGVSKDPELDSSKKFGLLLVSCLIVKKLTFSDVSVRKLWFSNDNNILSWIFQLVGKCNYELCLDIKFPGVLIPGKQKKMIDCFEYLLTHISAFLLTSTSKEFTLAETVLLKNVLQPNPWCALLASDIWCIMARSADGELCFNQLKHLCKLVNQIENWPMVPEKLYLEVLMRRLFYLTSQKHRDLLYDLYPPENFLYLWHIFNVQYLSPNLQNLVKSGVNEIGVSQTDKFLSKDDFGKLDFVKMESALLGLEMRCKESNEELESNLAKLWRFDSNLLESRRLGKRYIRALSAATGSVIPYMASKNILTIFQSMKASLASLPPICKLYCLDNIENMGKAVIPSGNSQASIFRLISSLFYEFLTSENVFLRTRSIEVFSNFASVTCHTQIITQSVNQDSALQNKIANHLQRKQHISEDWKLDSFLKKLESTMYKHFCECNAIGEDCDVSEPPAKKISIERTVTENPELDSIISVQKKRSNEN
ncbi:UNVERIFIED_CONTAM: hypothetical protein PYX00_001521 [Menopon gallinae]|uniref:Uncharacterized protein n=1 Tax=Menopon gallinae TaxID=328185 RepID=A0AAW2ID23_9NEOP